MPVNIIAAIMLVLASACGGGASSPTTTTTVVASLPAPRTDHAMVYDEARRVTFMFGGGGSETFGDSWTWNGTTWSRVATTGPSPRRLPSLVYDSRRQRVVLFGGQVGLTLLRDTWEWDGSTWTQRSTTGPEARIHQVAGYDRQRGKVVLYGGAAVNDQPLRDTWEWDGTTWTQVANQGVDRIANAMAFDQQRNQMLLLGVDVVPLSGRPNRTDLWSFSGTAWSAVGAALSGPELSPVQPLVTLGASGGVLLFDGGTLQGVASTWTWNGSWTKATVTDGPSIRNGVALAYDSERRRVVLFGGGTRSADFNDTWEWDGQRWLRVDTR
jgi:hypothetical protein